MKPAYLLPLVACLLITPLSAVAQEADLQWPQWRGPRRDGQLAGNPWPATAWPRPPVTCSGKTFLQGYMSSPIIIGDHAYIHLRNERLVCVGLADGKRTWTSKPMSVYLSMVAQGDKILALGDDGVLRLFAANPESETRLGEVRLLPPGTDDASWAHLAVAGEQFFVRDLTGVTAYRWTESAVRGRND